MEKDLHIQHDLLSLAIVTHLNNWLNLVYKPIQYLIANNLYKAEESGTFPSLAEAEREDRDLSAESPTFHKLENPTFYKLESLPPGYEQIEYFDRCAAEYDLVTGPFTAAIWSEVYKTIQPLVKENDSILNACCGTGTESMWFAEMAPKGKITSTDLSVGMTAIAFAKCLQANKTNMEFFQQDVADLPAAWSGQFQVTYCQLSLPYLSSWREALEQLFRVTAPGGLMILLESEATWYNKVFYSLVESICPAYREIIEERELREALSDLGCSSIYTKRILPGINLIICMTRKLSTRL